LWFHSCRRWHGSPFDREDDGEIRRIDIEADNVLELGGKGRVIGQLELAHLMGFDPVRAWCSAKGTFATR
jgi:hypothetical protein